MRIETRRLTLSDLAALIAASAVGLAISRAYWDSAGRLASRYTPSGVLSNQVAAIAPILGTTCLALLLLRLQNPRPQLRVLARQSGFAVCHAAATGMTFVLAWGLAHSRIVNTPALMDEWFYWIVYSMSFAVAPAVVSAWLGTRLGGRLSPTSDWIDRMGQALGLCWVVLFFAILFPLV